MGSISKHERCTYGAMKCINQAKSMHYAILLAPTRQDEMLCKCKYYRAVRHANKYLELAKYYGGMR